MEWDVYICIAQPVSTSHCLTELKCLQIDLDNEDKEGEGTGSQNIYACNKQTGKKPRGAESDSDLDFEYRPPPKM